ncbi:hypothetical protein [Dyella sp.]|jgi:hypothetical protein|uniref:hypothetical protein n=1 Tax=Dyella sp. TaxID=1869338 RepID=UPI002D79B20B|nr:hypothetical protein [Dyella sp.]HET6433404.1 hypothetical protein [Dyella sp.]
MLAVTALDELLQAVPDKTTAQSVVVGIDGFDGTGKTTLAYALAERLGGIRVGLDSYVEKDREAERYVGLLRLDALQRDLNGLSRCFSHIIVDGVCLLEAFERLGCTPDYLVYVKKISPQGLWHDGFHLEAYEASEAGSWLASSVYSYHRVYEPQLKAAACYSWARA